ncbi:WxL domain-containing protein [Enterococcus faecalis]|nr:WxL domain-containing protein [Enterococcus faecalis]MDN3076515.1 WxL domain-containing protein [Enterococcus faecalis]
MKQTKWQRLATIGLCSSLVINAFSGATAVAETITIESSPTVASSAKEATSASSATPESTESSQETTETSREEVTQETVEQEDTTEIAQEENLLEPSGIQAKIMPRAFVWAATGTTNRTTVRLNDVVDYRMKLENITTDDTNSDIVGPIRIESKLAAGMTRPTSVIIKVGPEEQNVVIGEGSHNANSGGEYFVWTESTRTVTAFINRLHGRTSGNTGYIKTLYFQTRITSGTHNEKKYIDSTIRFNGFGAVNRRNEMTYVDRFSGNLGLKGNLKFYDEDGVASKEQMSLSINPVLFKSTNSRVEGTLLRYPLTMTNAGSGLYRFDTGLKNIGTSNGGSWFFFSNDIAINFATATTNRIDKIVLAPPKATLPDSRTGVMTSRAYTSTTYTRSNYDISTYNFTKATGKTWRITNRSSNSGVSTNIMFSDNLVGTTGQFNKGNSGATINYYIYYKKLYENFVNSNGQKITPPSGFTQGKRTVINSEAYTFKQSGTLPDTYQADGKTYKFKGWYKGKTKPNTLTTTKAPSYAVTYNNDDDLTVVYEEIEFLEFPSRTYQFGFVDESGKRVDASTIDLTYDNWYGIGTEPPNNIPSAWATTKIETGIKANTKNNLKEIIYPVQSLETSSKDSFQFSAVNLRYQLPRIYKSISIQNQQGGFDAAYPYPSILNPSGAEINNTPQYFELKNNGGQEFVFNRTTAAAPENVQLPFYLRYVSSFLTGRAMYYTIQGPIYYYLTNRRVTENFVDTNGTKITPPTGFTQGKQTVINSDPYTFKQSGTLPETYKASNGKTYKFKGWYKGKTKPNTLTTTKAPSYPVTYNDDDDLNVVYEEIEAFDFPETTYQFGFVNEAGQLVNPDNINLTYDYKSIVFRGTGGAGSTVSFGTIANNQSGVKIGNLRQVTLPAKNIAQPTVTGWNGDAFTNFSIKLPKYYKSLNLYDKTGKIDPKYPLPVKTTVSSTSNNTVQSEASVIADLTLTQRADGSFTPRETYSGIDSSVRYPGFLRRAVSYSSSGSTTAVHQTISGPVYYHLTNRKVTESFKDTAGATIPAPTGFTQGKQTSITSNNYTFKQAGTLPETYKASNGKTYKFKGWYKGKTKPNTLTATKAPSYAVTYNNDDDLTVVYEEIEFFDFPALTYQFGFVDESGKRVDASTIDLTYDNWHGELLSSVDGWKTTNIEKGQVALTKNNLKEIVYPSHSLEIMNGRHSQYSAANLTFKIPKYYENISVYNKNGTFDTAYPFPTIKVNTSTTPLSNRPQLFQLKKSNNQSFIFNQTTAAAPADVQVPYNLREIVYDPATSVNKGLYHMLDKPIYYYLTNRKVTENFVDTNGTKITPPTGFTQGNQIPMTSNTFKYTAAKALPATYTAGGKTYTFQGWYKGKTKPNTLTTSTTPTYNTTFDGNDDMTAMYKEEVPKASVALTRTTAETVTSGGNVTWRATITNTSQAPLTTATIKKSTAWTTGLAAPTAMIVTPAGGTAKTVPVTATTWTNGVSLGTDIPVGKSATVQFTTKATGTAGQVLRAGITTSGNYSGVSASATVRVKDNDQAIVTPTAEGFISVPTFNFGQVDVASATKQHGLKKAADYYGNGTRNPYLRIKKTQANWSLTAQLSQPKSATDSLPTATRLLLGAAPVSSFSNYNQPTELKNAVGATSTISLNANNTATRIIANQQFTGSNIYQLDFTFNNIKLEVPANQGVKGQQYQAAVTWNLVTGP